ncbi:MAG: hypothetical protein DRN99_01430 [Thermoproteota archaeon]|nr:MAG: hypothetical protein DRN99_01430 [Candidatus Korarchaeota archaeon]
MLRALILKEREPAVNLLSSPSVLLISYLTSFAALWRKEELSLRAAAPFLNPASWTVRASPTSVFPVDSSWQSITL